MLTDQASAIIQAQKVYLHMSTPVGYQILLALSMQMFGLGLAGLAYRYIVEPPQMVVFLCEHRCGGRVSHA